MRARLLLAFFAISAFAVLAAAAGIYAFREVGARLDIIDTRVPPGVSSLELSRSAERIIAAAPALLAATDRSRRDEIKAALAAEVERLGLSLRELKSEGAHTLTLGEIEPAVSSLTANLAALDDAVAHRLDASDRLRALRRGVFQTNDEAQRLLAPWLEVMASQIAALVADGGAGQEHLAPLIQLQRLTQTAQRQVSAAADMLAEASTSEQADRLPVLRFQLGLALRDFDETAAGLDPKLRPLLLEQVAKLREFADGPDAVTEARRQELALIEEGERQLAATAKLSAKLTAAVDRLATAAKRDIDGAIGDALSVQQLGTRVLIGLVALSLLTSVLIVWLYVGGNIVRRLTALSDGMLAIAGGKLDTPVAAQGGDEIAAMGRAVEVFRHNAIELGRLLEERKQAAARLEQEVEARTRDLSVALEELQEKSRQIEIADKYKSHFLASASHDLRQPLHALNLFVAQLRAESDPDERRRLAERIEAAVGSMNELFESLLDMSKLEAGILEPNLSAFPVERLFKRIETTFADAARAKGLRLAVVPSRAWVRSDFILLERILMNLVSNAVRYTAKGGVVVGCRRRGGRLRINVCDSGAGIAPEQQQNIFAEYYRLAAAEPDHGSGFGLGLAIVDRLGKLLNHRIELKSRPGRGSRFSVSVPLAAEQPVAAAMPATSTPSDPARGKLVLVIDDDALVLDGMGGTLRGWGCDVLTADSDEAAAAALSSIGKKPDLIISDYRLTNGKTGIEAIERLRNELGAPIPAFLISGDTAPERLRYASESGFHLLHKPVAPMRLRAVLNQLLKAASLHAAGSAAE